MFEDSLTASVMFMTKDSTTALTAPSPAHSSPARKAVVVSETSKPVLRMPPSDTSAATVPSVVMEVIVTPSELSEIDQPCAPFSESLPASARLRS